MLKGIKNMIQTNQAYLEESEVILEDVMGNLDDSIVLGEDGDDTPVEDQTDDPVAGEDSGDTGSDDDVLGSEADGEEEEPVEASEEDIMNSDADDDGSNPIPSEPINTGDDAASNGDGISDLGTGEEDDILNQDANEETPAPAPVEEPVADDTDDILSMEIDLQSNTPKDNLPIPPAGAGDVVQSDGDENITTQHVDSGFGDDDAISGDNDNVNDNGFGEAVEAISKTINSITESCIGMIVSGSLDEEALNESTASTKYIHKLAKELDELRHNKNEILKIRRKHAKGTEEYKLCTDAKKKIDEKIKDIKNKSEKLGTRSPHQMDSLGFGKTEAKNTAKFGIHGDYSEVIGKDKKNNMNAYKTDPEDIKELKNKLKELTESVEEVNLEVNSLLEAITIDGGDGGSEGEGESGSSEEGTPDEGMSDEGENDVTSAVRDKVAEADSEGGSEEPAEADLDSLGADIGGAEGSGSKDEIFKKLSSLTKSLEDAKAAVIKTM